MLHLAKKWLIILFFMVNTAGIARSAPAVIGSATPTVQFKISLQEEGSEPSGIKGELTWKGVVPDADQMVCFYLPYEDPEFGSRHGSMGRFETISGLQPQATLHNGSLRIDVLTQGVTTLTQDPDHILRLRLPPDWQQNQPLQMLLNARVPRPRFSHPLDWFYDGFMPQILPNCQTSNFTHLDFLYLPYTHFEGLIFTPSSWIYQGPGERSSDGSTLIQITGHTLAFALQKNTNVIEFESAGIPIRIFPRSKSFLSLRSTVEEMLPKAIEKLGPAPFKSLSIVETTEVQRTGLPGIIAINKPAQAFFDKLQVDWINWRHWVLLSQIIKQWYGAAISVENPSDNWLIDGLVEFVLLDLLAENKEKWDLFRPIFDGNKPLSFTYLQVAEIFAGMLRQNAPFATLTDISLRTRDSWQAQNNLLFIKHTFALREIAEKSGTHNFFAQLRNANKNWLFNKVNPRDFFEMLDRRPSPISPYIRDEIKSDLMKWWTQEGWPDFGLKKFEQRQLQDGKWTASIEAHQLGEIDFNPSIVVVDENGRSYSRRMQSTESSGGKWQAEVLTNGKPITAMIDPEHVTFDSNRFDNSSETPRIVFFPGSTNTLRDDAYTILWVPYPQRRPGEALTLGIGASIRHYLESGLAIRMEFAPATRRGSYSINQEWRWPRYGLSSTILASHSYFNDRRIEVSIVRSPLFSVGPRISVASKIRRKGEAGKPRSDHFTIGLSSSLRPASNWNPCQPSLSLEWEKAPTSWTQEISYEKRTASVLGTCLFPKGINARIRGFFGALLTHGEPPLTSKFRPNDLYETGLRLDSTVTRVNQVTAMQADLYLPLILPLPKDLMILPRQMKWRFFHDLGKSTDSQITYRSAGMGFFLPFGGDLSGAGSLTVSRISMLAILYQKVGSDITRRPSIIFDLTGEI